MAGSSRQERFEYLMSKRVMTEKRAWEIIDANDAPQAVEPVVMRLTDEQEQLIVNYLTARAITWGCILRGSDYPALRTLATTEVYHGKRVMAVRRCIDQLDNITVEWIR